MISLPHPSRGTRLAGIILPGTATTGRECNYSVLDLDCDARELDNLHFADASLFPSIGAVEPDADHHRRRAAGSRPGQVAAGVTRCPVAGQGWAE